MLEPHLRQHLIEALRPPAGYELDIAMGTTYSLNLYSLLTAPLAFTIFDWEDAEGRPTANPLALLEVMRRYADRIGIFCEAGRIQAPPKGHPLFVYLEECVFQVTAPNGGSFHPKAWALRFSPSEEGPVIYRLLCSSRNLTFDRSWDTLLLLEGELTNEASENNRPLGDFFGALPGRSVHSVPQRVSQSADRLREELGRVRFELPEEFDSVAFLPFGLEGGDGHWPFEGPYERLVVVSPFVTRRTLRRLAAQSTESTLVSRVESLAKIPREDLGGFAKGIHVLGPMTEPENEDEAEELEALDDEDNDDEDEARSDDRGTLAPLMGLHAKLYVADTGESAHVWTGSANATDAAFGANVEFLVELVGDLEACGTDSLLGEGAGDPGFKDLLTEYRAGSKEPESNPDQEKLEGLVDQISRRLSRTGFTATVSESSMDAERFDIRLAAQKGQSLTIEPGISVTCWPATLKEPTQDNLGSEGTVTFDLLSFEALTSFFCFEVSGSKGKMSSARRFVVNVPLKNAPEDRGERVLRYLLDSQEKVLRLILFLLAEGDSGDAVAAVRDLLAGDPTGGQGDRNGWHGLPLFEQMVRALAHNPTALDRIDALITDLRKGEESSQVIPEGWDAIWEPLKSARKKVRPR